jgi:flagellar biosynthesis protein FlhF
MTPGQQRLVALIGPTGVGKTTTIAKLAANFHLREQSPRGADNRRHIPHCGGGAAPNLRGHHRPADGSRCLTPQNEMRQAVDRLSEIRFNLHGHCRTQPAGRSEDPGTHENMLTEAQPDEVHLVLSSVSSVENLKKTAQAVLPDVGVTSLVLTKLDEATGLGGLITTAPQLPLAAELRDERPERAG